MYIYIIINQTKQIKMETLNQNLEEKRKEITKVNMRFTVKMYFLALGLCSVLSGIIYLIESTK